ncbi:Trigger factor-like protein TIG, Chloroplastic [Linum perenne]
MELCISSTTTTLLPASRQVGVFGFNTSPSGFALVRPLFLQLNRRGNCSLNFRKLSWLSPEIPRPELRQCSSKVSAAAASSTSVAVEDEKDILPAELNITETKEPNSRVRLGVEVPSAVCEDCHKRVLKAFTQKAKVPGFRPGKRIPETILINYVGKQYFQKAVVESILKRTLPHALTSVNERALKDSVHIASSLSEMEKTYSSLKTLRYEILVDVAPEIKWNPEDGYKNLKVIVEIDSDIDALTASEQEFRRRHKSLGSMRIVTDRGLQVGDVAVLDISSKRLDSEESDIILDAESKGFNFDTEEGDSVIPGFLNSIIGIRQGEVKSFPLTFPETWRQENLRGLHAQFSVECKELFYRDLPQLDDSVAEKLLPGCTSIEQVKESLLEKCVEVEQTAREQATDNAILDLLCKMVEVDIPRSLFEEQGRQLYGAKLLSIQTRMKLNEEQLTRLSSPKAVNEYLENQEENIIRVIKQNLAVGDIFKREKLEFPTEDLIKEVENSIAEFKRNNQEYDEDSVKEQVQEVLEGVKVLEWLREQAEIQYITK